MLNCLSKAVDGLASATRALLKSHFLGIEYEAKKSEGPYC